jgi:ElaB/YqjD/DUF883 family membrane-anchored ribosome-binding protein
MTTHEANQKLRTDLKHVARDAEALLKATADGAGEKLNEVRGRLSNALESAKDTYYWIQETSVDTAKATDKVIRRHPYESIGIAFGVGLLVGVLARRH